MGNVAVTALRPNPWNTNLVSPENEAKIEASFKRLGMFKPIVVRTVTGGVFEILGGQHRWEAAVRLGVKEVPIFNVGTVSDQIAKEIGLVDNGRYGEDDSFALSSLLQSLGSAKDLASFLPYSDLDLTNIFSASSVALDALDLTNSQLPDAALPPPPPPATHQIMRFKVPVEDIAWISALIESTMKNQNLTGEDSLTNAGNSLVHLLKPLS